MGNESTSLHDHQLFRTYRP